MRRRDDDNPWVGVILSVLLLLGLAYWCRNDFPNCVRECQQTRAFNTDEACRWACSHRR